MTDGTFGAKGFILNIGTPSLIFHLEAYQDRFVRSTLIFIGFQVLYTISPTRSPYRGVCTTATCHMPAQEAIQAILLPCSSALEAEEAGGLIFLSALFLSVLLAVKHYKWRFNLSTWLGM